MVTYSLPLWSQPVIRRAIRVPFSSENMDRQYQHATVALHQHHYSGKVEIDGTSYPLNPGDITLTPPQVISRYELAEPGHHWCIHFDPPAPQGETFELPLYIPASSGGASVGEQIQAIHDITRYRATNSSELRLMAAAAGTRLSALLLGISLRNIRARTGPAHRKSDDALDVARQRLEREFHLPLSVAEITRASGLSPHYFAVRFQQRFGVTVSAYLLSLRLEMARHLLLSTNLAVKEVAFECGIPDPQYFNKQFRRATGVSPTEYRSRSTAK